MNYQERQTICAQIEAKRAALVDAVLAARAATIGEAATARMFAANPFWAQQFGARGRAICLEDNLYHLSYLQDALGAGSAPLFGAYLAWLIGFLGKRSIDSEHIRADLAILAEEIGLSLPPGDAKPFQQIVLAVHGH